LSLLKEGAWEDAEHRAEIAPLLRFHSSSQEGWISLPDYLSRLQAGQDTIWFGSPADLAPAQVAGPAEL